MKIRICKYPNCDNRILTKYNTNGRPINSRQTHCDDHFIGRKVTNKNQAFGNFISYRRTIMGEAKKNELAFNLSLSYLRSIYPMFSLCPITQIKLDISAGKHEGCYPYLKMRDPELGFVQDNVFFISQAAHIAASQFDDVSLQKFCKYYLNNVK